MSAAPQALHAPRDRSRRLLLFGALAIAVGAGAGLLALVQLALPLLGSRMAGAAESIGWRQAGAASMTWAMIAAAFVSAGIGSMRYRRWVRSTMLALAWGWLIFGVTTLVMIRILLPGMMASAGADALPEGAGSIIGLGLLLAIGACGVVLPLVFVWVYRDPDLLRTCEARSPGADWTAGCPAPVLGLAVGLAGCAALALPMALQPAVPFFGRVVTGVPGVALTLAGAVGCGWLAWETRRLRPAGYWGTVAFLVLVGLSTGVTFAVADPAVFLGAVGLPPEQVGELAGFGTAGLVLAVVLTAISLVYMARIRRHFPRRG